MKNPVTAPTPKDPRKRVMDGCHRGWMAGSSSGWNRATWPANPGDTIAYGYNSRSEVTTAIATTRTAYDFDYSYDNIGNRATYAVAGGTATTYEPNELNQYIVTANPTEAFVYDDDGNLTEDGDFVYAWDAENRLTSALAAGVVKVEFTYDYMSRRVRKLSYDRVSGNWVQQTDQKFVYDGNGNVSEALRVSNGTIEAHYEYDPFGNTTATSGTWAGANPYRFSTKWFDGETSLYYYGLRSYSPRLGRWTSRDPIGERGGANLCGFLANRPSCRVDPLGLASNVEQMAARFLSLNCAMEELFALANDYSNGSAQIRQTDEEEGYRNSFVQTFSVVSRWDDFLSFYGYYNQNYSSSSQWTVMPWSQFGINLPGFEPIIDTNTLLLDPTTAIQTLIHEPLHDLNMFGLDTPHNKPGYRWDELIGLAVRDAITLATAFRVHDQCCTVSPNNGKPVTNWLEHVSCKCRVPMEQQW